MAQPKGPQGKVFKPQISPEARARIEREHREAVTRATNESMAHMPLNGRCGNDLERLNVLCRNIGAPALQVDTLKKDFAQMIIDEALNGKLFDEAYKKYFGQKLSGLLAAGAKAQNDDLFKPIPAGGANSIPRSNEITDTFERFMQSFAQNMRAHGIRRTNTLPALGGNDSKELYDIQMAAHKTLIRNSAQTAYEKCSDRGNATVSQTLQAARRAVDNAFLYANAFPAPSSARADMTHPDMAAAAVSEAANVIRGLQQAHSSRSFLWMLRHPIDYLRESAAIRSLTGVLRERGGLTQAEADQKLSASAETYDGVTREYNEICDRYSERKLSEAETELAEERRQREAESVIAHAIAHSVEEIHEDGLDKEQVDARGRAEFEADLAAWEELEGQNAQAEGAEEEQERQRSNSDLESQLDLSENDKVPVEIAEEPVEEKSEPVVESDRISAPQIDLK